MQTNKDLLRIGARSVLLTVVLWLLFLAIATRFEWPLYAAGFMVAWIVPMTISAGSIPLTAVERFLLILGVSVTVVVLTFASMPLIYPGSTWSIRGLLGAVILGALIGTLSTLIVPRLRDSRVRR
jgi:hypothetical protein